MIDTTLPYCVYRTTHPEGFYYIGKSQCIKVIHGKYQGSGTRLNAYFNSEHYHPSTWDTTIIATFDTEAEAYAYERELVTAVELTDPKCVNDQTGGKSGFTRNDLMNSGQLNRDQYPSRTIESVKTFDAVIGGVTKTCVDLADLHAFLCVTLNINTWFKRRLESYNCFVEGVDWREDDERLALQKCKSSHGGQNKKYYIITLDMAKGLSMVEKTEKGAEARAYFINIEKQYYAQHPTAAIVETRPELTRALEIFTDAIAVGGLFGVDKITSGKRVKNYVKRVTGIDAGPLLK